MKTPLRLAAALAAVFLLASCSAPAADSTADSTSAPTEQVEQVEEVEEAPEPVDLSGEWKQTNSGAEDSFQSATITGQTIEVFWNSPDMQAIYWAGTVEVPADGSTSFTWDSVNDKTKTDNALMASSDDTKTFTYTDGELSYELTALGTTMTVRLAKQ
ncbi:hypothetical protein [Microbacterium sp.]|uniref:hypothetical protein n=1 Tax=Microbacterium sp. TaxID=51671 RepID=UPI00289ADB29|nr:hypothetical protein [Microbacterium sp.]